MRARRSYGRKRLVIIRSWEDTRERLKGVAAILGRLAAIAAAPPAQFAKAR